jgi:hypothetical protein
MKLERVQDWLIDDYERKSGCQAGVAAKGNGRP